MRGRRASGGREETLLRRAKTLRSSVDLLLPRPVGDAERDRIDRLREELEEVRAARDEKSTLEKLLRRGDDIPRAYAGLLRFYLEPEMPDLLVASYPTGEIAYAPLSRASREGEIAVQQGDDPRRLLFGYLDWARKGYHFFATPKALLTTGRNPRPPREFLDHILPTLPYRLQPDGNGRFSCSHLASGARLPFLSVAWPDAGTEYRICTRCARPDRHLLSTLSGGVAGPDPESMLPVDVSLGVDCRAGAGCPHQSLPDLSRGSRKKYILGRLSDAAVLGEYRTEALESLQRSSEPLWVAAGRCFGSDREAFVRELHPTPEEERALGQVLPRVRGYFEVPDGSASQALERLWKEHAEEIVAAIVPDPREAGQLVSEARANPGRVSDLLSRAASRTRERAILGALPHYRWLSPEAMFVDSTVRELRVQGPAQAERRLEQSLPREGKVRGLAWALLLAMGRAEAHRWQFTDTERSFGDLLAPRAQALVESAPDAYDAALGAFLSSAGLTGWGERESGTPSAETR